MTDEDALRKNTRDPVAALALADLLEEQGVAPGRLDEYRARNRWLLEVAPVLAKLAAFKGGGCALTLDGGWTLKAEGKPRTVWVVIEGVGRLGGELWAANMPVGRQKRFVLLSRHLIQLHAGGWHAPSMGSMRYLRKRVEDMRLFAHNGY